MKIIMKINIVKIVILLFTSMAFGQNTLTGTVQDEKGQPLFGATVLLDNEYGTMTDKDGTFTFVDMVPGSHSVTVSYIGYGKENKTFTITETGTAQISFRLFPSAEQLQPVEIIGRREVGYKNTISYAGTKSAAPVKEVPTTINFVTKELALDQAAFSLNDVVKNVSGVNQFSFYNDISIRGFRVAGQRNSGNLVNGMRAFTSFWKPQLIPHIERVEVIKVLRPHFLGTPLQVEL